MERCGHGPVYWSGEGSSSRVCVTPSVAVQDMAALKQMERPMKKYLKNKKKTI